MPYLSVLIPAYNASRFIEHTLQSVLRERSVDIECIIVDDASSDDTVAIIRRIDDPRIRLFQNKVNCGEFVTRNRTLKEAKGRWLALLDADDLMLPGRLPKLLAIAEAENADLIADNLIIHDTTSGRKYDAFSRRLLTQVKWLSPELFAATDLPDMRACFGHFQPLIRREFIEKFHIRYIEDNPIGSDFTFCFDCLLSGARYRIHPEAGYIYNIHSSSVSRDSGRRAWQHLGEHAKQVSARAEAAGREDLKAHLSRREKMFRRYVDYRVFADALKRKDFTLAFSSVFKTSDVKWDALRYISLALRRRLFRQTVPMQRTSLR